MHVGRGRSPDRADRVSVGPVVSNSEPLSPGLTPGLACGGAAQWYRSVKVAKYHKYSSDTQINVVKVSLPHTLFWLLRFVKLKPCIRPVDAPVYETSQLVYETSDTKHLVYKTSGIPCHGSPVDLAHGRFGPPPVDLAQPVGGFGPPDLFGLCYLFIFPAISIIIQRSTRLSLRRVLFAHTNYRF